MKTIALIPARYAASRFPGKLMQQLQGKTVILRTYEAAKATGLFDAVAVVCDSNIIYDEITRNGGWAIMSTKEHECGTDRIAEAISEVGDAEIIVNIQGDEPFTQSAPLQQLLGVFSEDAEKKVQVASMMQVITDKAMIEDPNCVKVVVNKYSDALLFSRSAIPYPRDKDIATAYYKHIGIYAFRKQALAQFASLPPGMLELTEKQEGMRFLENGINIRMIVTDYINVGIDTPEDLAKAQNLLSKEI